MDRDTIILYILGMVGLIGWFMILARIYIPVCRFPL
jgi:hypothetical protein